MVYAVSTLLLLTIYSTQFNLVSVATLHKYLFSIIILHVYYNQCTCSTNLRRQGQIQILLPVATDKPNMSVLLQNKLLIFLAAILMLGDAFAFTSSFKASFRSVAHLSASGDENHCDDTNIDRRKVVSSLGFIGANCLLSSLVSASPAVAQGEEDTFASIAARANKISRELESSTSASEVRKTDKTAYDFSMPVDGNDTPFADIIHQEFGASGKDPKVKAILVVNIKQDDPIARKNIPELISLVTK